MPPPSKAKIKALREQGTLNTRPEGVHDPLFAENDFFDPHDLVQVKYEMLRRHHTESSAPGPTAKDFGFSRITFYQVLKRFKEQGMEGLLPKSRGPKGAHKLSEDLMNFVEHEMAQSPPPGTSPIADAIKARFGISVHPRSIERALARRQKKQRR
jgi:hypothetical protein